MKSIFIYILIFFVFEAFAQQEEPLGINLEGYEYPFEVSYYKLHSQNQQLEMAYMYEKASDPNGKTAMLFHGKNFNGAYWEQTMTDLLDAGFNVIVPDQIGFGKSSKPAYYQYTFQTLANNTKQLLDSLQIKQVQLLGHSMGGMLATRFALMYPDKVNKLALVNPIGLEDWKRKVPYQPVEFWYKRELGRTYEKVKNYQLENYYDGNWKPAYNEWVYLLTAFLNSPDYHRYAWNSALTYDMIFTQPVVYEFDQLEMPVLLIIGQRDRTALGKNLVVESVAETMGNYPELGQKTAEEIPQSTLVELEGIGHLPHIEAYGKFIQPLMKFFLD